MSKQPERRPQRQAYGTHPSLYKCSAQVSCFILQLFVAASFLRRVSARLTSTAPTLLPWTAGALRLYTFTLHAQTPHITPRTRSPAQPSVFVKTLPFPVFLIIAIRQIAQLKLILNIVIMHQARAFAARAPPHARAVALHVQFLTASRLHAAPGREAADGIAGDAVGERVAEGVAAVGIVAGQVEQVDAGEDDEEAAEEGDCVYGGGGVEALEQKAGCDEREGREGYVVEGVDAAGC